MSRSRAPVLLWVRDEKARARGEEALRLRLVRPGGVAVDVAAAQPCEGGWFSYRLDPALPLWNTRGTPRDVQVVQAEAESTVRARHPAFVAAAGEVVP